MALVKSDAYNLEMARNRLPLPDFTALRAREQRVRDSRNNAVKEWPLLSSGKVSAYAEWYNGGSAVLTRPISETNKLSYYPELSGAKPCG